MEIWNPLDGSVKLMTDMIPPEIGHSSGYYTFEIQARIAQLVAHRLGTGEVPGSNPGKGENFSVKISNWIV